MRLPPEISDVMAAAVERARAAGRPHPTLCDLLDALIDVPAVEAMIRGGGGDPQILRSELSADALLERPVGFLARVRSALFERGPGGGTFLFRRAVATTITQRRLVSKPVRAVDLFVAACGQNHEGLAGALDRAGVSRLRLLRWLCHGESPGGHPDLPEGQDLDVVIANDDYTSMDVVIRVLQVVFGMNPGDAFKMMMTVHREGAAVVGRYARAEALRLAAQATQVAEAAEAPLQVLCRGAEGPA